MYCRGRDSNASYLPVQGIGMFVFCNIYMTYNMCPLICFIFDLMTQLALMHAS